LNDFKLYINSDYKVDLVVDENNNFVLTKTLAETVMNNLILSIMINRGELLSQPLFGSRRSSITASGDAGARQLEMYDREATQWIIDERRASAIDIVAAPVAGEPGRFNETITATLITGETVEYTTFFKVV
jgi:phage gp46-like protein